MLGENERKINPRQPGLLAQLADAYSMLGKRGEALDAAAAAERLGPDADAAFALVNTFEQLGERSLALKWLERAIASGYSLDSIERSPSLTALRKDARYQPKSRKSVTH